MKNRLHLIEIHEQSWCPNSFRDAVTDYLQFAIAFGDVYAAALPLLKNALQATDSEAFIDLCAGGGGPWVKFKEDFPHTDIILTDLYPNRETFRQLKENAGLNYSSESVNALDVPENFTGFRTMFSAFHHFKPAQAEGILRDAVENQVGIGIFEATPRNAKSLLAMLLAPLLVLFLTPRIKPFKWSRLFFTYPVPVIPLIVGFDGIVSVLRTYTEDELLSLASSAGKEYAWQAGTVQAEKSPIPVVYLIGYPKALAAGNPSRV